MKITAFSDLKTGKLVPISLHGRDDHAFVPNPLWPSVVRNDRFWPLLLEARTKLERLSAVGSQLPDVNLLLRPLQRREALTSNSLEGTFVTPQELLLFEARQQMGGEQGRRDDWMEVFAYDSALRLGCRWIQSGYSIDNDLIKKLHLALLSSSARGREKQPGEFRKSHVFVGELRYTPPPRKEMDEALVNLEYYLSAPPDDVDPLIAAYATHYQFEAIHPFQDGNGRIGRLVLSLCVYKWLGLSTPCLYMSEFFENNRKDYISHLFRISTHGDWDDWIRFCLEGTIEQATASIARCEKLQALKKGYQEALGTDGKSLLLLDDLFSSPFMTVADAQKKFNVSYRPAKTYLRRMEAAGVVVEMKNQYPRTFIAREIFETAYGQ